MGLVRRRLDSIGRIIFIRVLICHRIWGRLSQNQLRRWWRNNSELFVTADGTNTSVVSVPTSPLIVQVFPTGQSAATNSAGIDLRSHQLVSGNSEDGIGFLNQLTLIWLYRYVAVSNCSCPSNTKFVQKVRSTLPLQGIKRQLLKIRQLTQGGPRLLTHRVS